MSALETPEVEYLDGVGQARNGFGWNHGIVHAAMMMTLRDCAEYGYGGGSWTFRIGKVDGTTDVLIADAAFVSYERMEPLTEEDREEPPFAPDVAIEVREKDEDGARRERKISRYLATGSVLVLDVDPTTRTIRAHARDGITTYAKGEVFAHDTVAWLRFDVADVFADLD